MAIFQTMPDYQQSLVISELQRSLAKKLELDSEPKLTPVEPAPGPVPKPKPKPKPNIRSSNPET
ncbi:hypothetical protein C7271_13045 [filamentous cyanobacterium CCP5]|nr:hypothetical protein C7271_13045 [filamentous cyanobacterium CCP5]